MPRRAREGKISSGSTDKEKATDCGQDAWPEGTGGLLGRWQETFPSSPYLGVCICLGSSWALPGKLRLCPPRLTLALDLSPRALALDTTVALAQSQDTNCYRQESRWVGNRAVLLLISYPLRKISVGGGSQSPQGRGSPPVQESRKQDGTLSPMGPTCRMSRKRMFWI